MIKKILLGLVGAFALLVVILLIVISLQPASFSVTRSQVINTPAAVPFGYVNSLQEWPKWSPFEKMDPNLKRTFSGSEAGTGAKYAWAGNSNAGEGLMTITDSRPAELVSIKLDFIKPFQATNQVNFTFTPEAGGTRVSWTMSGDNNFMGKAMSLVMNMDEMCGSMFEEGLTNLKNVSENPAPVGAGPATAATP
jgi:hypothetical protein